MHRALKILVVGTTSDYIEWIRNECPDRVLFITDPEIRDKANEKTPFQQEEILCDLSDHENVRLALSDHLDRYHQKISGITCYDCEHMPLTSFLAKGLGLDYPSSMAISNCRDKFVSKFIWKKHGIPCPRVCPVNSAEEAFAFLNKTRQLGIVLKPFSGSGSELIFRCKTRGDCESAFKIILDGLEKRSVNPLFKRQFVSKDLMLAEEFINGPEYSCDFIVEKGKVRLIRITRKIKSEANPFGTALGYLLTSRVPGFTDISQFEKLLFDAADSLGIHRGICMVDFLINDNRPCFIEMTPRPGGDCLPFLLKTAGNIDIIKSALDFAEKQPVLFNHQHVYSDFMGIRIHAGKSGRLKNISTEKLMSHPGIRQVHVIRKPGHRIVLPPEDYDSWYIGHIIMSVDGVRNPEAECLDILQGINLDIETLI